MFHRHTIHIVWFPFFTQTFFAHSNRNQPHPNITNQRPVTAGGAYPPVQRAHYAISRELYTRRRRNPARFLRCIPFACRTAPRARNEPSVGVNEIRNTTGLSSTIVEPHRHD